MEYFKYTLQFLNTITFTSSTYTELDNFLNGVVKGYLNHNFGFLPIAPTEDELDELADEIGANYDLMLDDIKPRYEEVLRLGTVHTFRSKDTTKSEYGAEDRTGKYYEPVVSSAQAEVKTNGENTTWGDDTTTLDREEDRVLSESAIKDFFKEIKEEVELYFIDFVNIYADGTGCQKPYTLEQLEAINSGATKTKIEQIQTNKENIDLLVDAVDAIGDALDDKQDKLNATQLDAVNSGINATKVAQIETNKNNIAQLSNPNLLINGDFRVNQRDKPQYLQSANDTYTVDRWRFHGSNGTLNVNSDNTVTYVIGENNWCGLKYFIENPSYLSNKTITLSLKGTSTSGMWSTIYHKGSSIGGSSYTNQGGTFYLTKTINCGEVLDTDNFEIRLTTRNTNIPVGVTNNSFTLEYVKLEIGEIATPFSPRPYAEELAMCQRYYQVFKSQTLRCDLYVSSQILFTLPTPVSLRNYITLTMGTGSGIQAVTGGSVDTNWTFSVLTPKCDNVLKLRAVPNGSQVPTDCVLNFQNTTSIDAEIY